MNKRIVGLFADGSHVNFPADRIEVDAENNMYLVYRGKALVGAFEISSVMKLYITDKRD